jgi:hypothetical protein
LKFWTVAVGVYSARRNSMKRFSFLLLILIAVSACAPKPEPPPAPLEETTPDAAPPPVPAEPTSEPVASTTLSIHYMDAAAALAADDLEKAKTSLAALAKESTGELQKLAQAAADTGDIAATRERFKALSAVATTLTLPDGYAVAFCPMYKGGSKWVQKKDAIHNPYFGKAMSTCGSFVN